MKNITKLSILLFLPILAGVGCDKQDLPECVTGTVIGYERCSNAVIIQVKSHPGIGEDIK